MRVDDLYRAAIADCAIKRRPTERTEHAFRPLLAYFGQNESAANITYSRLAEYAAWRMKDHAPGTAKLELAYFRKAFRILARDGLVAPPVFPAIRVDNARSGWFEPEQTEAICMHLPAYAVPYVRFLSFTGWRGNEARELLWVEVDFDRGVLYRKTSKNGEPRIFPFRAMSGLELLLRNQHARTDVVAREYQQEVPWVFWIACKRLRVRPMTRMQRAWNNARRKAGFPERIPHDYRRTVVRDLTDAGVNRKDAKILTGHKTDQVFDRYNIRDEKDLHHAVELLARHRGEPAKDAASAADPEAATPPAAAPSEKNPEDGSCGPAPGSDVPPGQWPRIDGWGS